MELHFPAYYHNFSCIAAACPDSCCKEWIVDVDPDSAARYRALKGSLGDRLRAVLQDTKNGTVMEIENGRCPMWREDGLCRIQAELGHSALCNTCREYPRLRHDYGAFAELDLELSCPEAARLILCTDDTLCTQQTDIDTLPDYDADTMQLLLHSRENALTLLREPRYSPAQALAILLLYAHDIQAQIDGYATASFAPDTLLSDAKKYVASGDLGSVFAFFQGLEILTPRWASLLRKAPSDFSPGNATSALARYFVRRYWLQAVSDLDLVCRVKFILTACILIASLDDDHSSVAQLFSKEIENNPDNVDALLDGAYTTYALTDQNLFSLLLG